MESVSAQALDKVLGKSLDYVVEKISKGERLGLRTCWLCRWPSLESS